MRRVFFPLFLLMFMFGKAQDKESKDIAIRIACGFAGVTSMDVNNVQRLATSKNYILLKGMLFSDNKTAAILSAITLQELQTKGLLSLSNDEQQRINTIREWNHKYSVCYTCTEHFEGTVNELLTNKRNPAYLLISRTVLKAN